VPEAAILGIAVASASILAANTIPPELSPKVSGEAVLQRAGRACLDHLLANEQAARLGDAEGIHQMRVAVRRLRAILFLFSPCLPKEPRRSASNELRWFANALGAARNLDVFVTDLLTPAKAALPKASELERLAIASEKRRRIAHGTARKAIGSARYAASVRTLMSWFNERQWRRASECEELMQPIGKLAPILLQRCRHKFNQRSKRFARQSETERHRLRVALKRLRYATELLAGLYDSQEVGRFIRRLKQLQDELGYINDVQTAHELLSQLAEPSAPETGIAYAGRRILAWHKLRLSDNEPKLRRHVRQLRQVEPFWDAKLRAS
jgi:CHAD domain-containing protein